MTFKTVFKTFRLPFLVLTPVCVLLGLSTSVLLSSQIDYFLLILILVGATSAHISVNTLNEYQDYKSGLDLKTDKTPFSGGSGALPDDPESASAVLNIGIFSLIITVLIGLYLSIKCGYDILPIGIVGIILVITYTKWINRSPIICLISPGLGFGVLMVVGTHVILTSQHSVFSCLISLVPFLLINNLLLINQYPYKIADASFGRKTFPVFYGLTRSNSVYLLNLLLAYTLITLYIVSGLLPTLSFVSLLPVGFALYTYYGIKKFSSEIAKHPTYMAANVATAILTPLLLAISLFFY